MTFDKWIQVVTAVAVLFGLGLVVWELRQTRDLAWTQLIHGNTDQMMSERTAIYGEEMADVLQTACLHPDRLDASEAFMLDNYFSNRTIWLLRFRAQVVVAGVDRDWLEISTPYLAQIASFPQGEAWLRDYQSRLLGSREVVELIDSVLASKPRKCSEVLLVMGVVPDG